MTVFHSQPYGVAGFPPFRRDVSFEAARPEASEERIRVRFRLNRGAAYALAMMVLFVGVLFYLCPRLQMVNEIYQYRALQDRYKALSHEQRLLRVQLGTLESLSRIDRVARERLGMKLPEPSQMIFVPLSPRKPTGGNESSVQSSQP